MVTKKIRTEYMKKFRDPRWETFSKCYEDSLKYRLTRRVMEHSHNPWFWEGWDSGSESSGWSTPRLTRNKVAPLSLPPPKSSEGKQKQQPPEDGEAEVGAGEATVVGAAPAVAVIENGVHEASSGPSDETATDNGPADTPSSDGEPANPAPRRRHRRRTPRPETGHRDSSHDDKPAVVRKLPRAKSQPPISTKENWRPSSRLDWTERHTEVRRTPNDTNMSDACVQTGRESDKRGSNLDRRRARSADLEKMRRSQLTVVEDRWMTEYMRCFSARLSFTKEGNDTAKCNRCSKEVWCEGGSSSNMTKRSLQHGVNLKEHFTMFNVSRSPSYDDAPDTANANSSNASGTKHRDAAL